MLLQHGHHLDSKIWFKEKKAGKPIPLQLFDAGYDVWVGNVRGTEYALEHKTLKSILPDYWNFTWDDIARYDIPAMMNLMKAATKQEKIFFMGYSHGATAMI